MTDHVRVPDESNPKGYYELEQVKQMKDGDTTWIVDSRGKVVKIISALLEYLPPSYEYRIVFMQRNMGEVLRSQREMLARRGEPIDRLGDHYLADLYEKHLSRVSAWLEQQPRMQVIYLHYNQIMADPQPSIDRLAEFLDPIPLDPTRMLSVVESSLYRQREHPVSHPAHQS
jgi:hypothetical protein